MRVAEMEAAHEIDGVEATDAPNIEEPHAQRMSVRSQTSGTMVPSSLNILFVQRGRGVGSERTVNGPIPTCAGPC